MKKLILGIFIAISVTAFCQGPKEKDLGDVVKKLEKLCDIQQAIADAATNQNESVEITVIPDEETGIATSIVINGESFDLCPCPKIVVMATTNNIATNIIVDGMSYKFPVSEFAGVECDVPTITEGVIAHETINGVETFRHTLGEQHIFIPSTGLVTATVPSGGGLGDSQRFYDNYLMLNPRSCDIITKYRSVPVFDYGHAGDNLVLESGDNNPFASGDGDSLKFNCFSFSFGNLSGTIVQQSYLGGEIGVTDGGLSQGLNRHSDHAHISESRIAPGNTYNNRTRQYIAGQSNSKQADQVFSINGRHSRIWYNDAEIQFLPFLFIVLGFRKRRNERVDKGISYNFKVNRGKKEKYLYPIISMVLLIIAIPSFSNERHWVMTDNGNKMLWKDYGLITNEFPDLFGNTSKDGKPWLGVVGTVTIPLSFKEGTNRVVRLSEKIVETNPTRTDIYYDLNENLEIIETIVTSELLVNIPDSWEILPVTERQLPFNPINKK